MHSPGSGRGAHNRDNVNAQWNHVNVFFENNSSPYLCDDCGEEVFLHELLVHHKDDDHGNDDPGNLAAMHRGCHTRNHRTGKKLSEETKAKMSLAHKSNPNKSNLASLAAKARWAKQKEEYNG